MQYNTDCLQNTCTVPSLGTMREINRSRYLRGTKSWPLRNFFIFGTIAFTVAIGVASVAFMPNQVEKIKQKVEHEKELNKQHRDKIFAIQQRRREMELENRKH